MHPHPARRALSAAILSLAILGSASPGGASARKHDDPLREQQWGLDRIHAPEAWRYSTGRGVLVAIVDSGVDLDHPELAGKLVVHPDADLIDPDGCTDNGCVNDGPQDVEGHGTAMAGIVAAISGNRRGIAGVAPDARILPVRVRDADGFYVEDSIARGIRYAADHGADVINLSLAEAAFPYEVEAAWQDNDPICDPGGICRYLKEMFEAIEYATDRGAVIVAAAGNGFPEQGIASPSCAQPGGHPKVLCVGAVDRDDRHAYYSNYDPFNANLVVAPSGSEFTGGPLHQAGLAPCEDRIATLALTGLTRPCPGGLPDGYLYATGTSSSTALVSGIAALLIAEGFRSEEVVRTIMGTAGDLGSPGPDAVYGCGIVDAVAAVRAAQKRAAPHASCTTR